MIKLNQILHLSHEELAVAKFELNIHHGNSNQSHLESWLSCSRENRENGTTGNSFWGWRSENRRNYQEGEIVFSFIDLGNDKWLLISAGKILSIPQGSCAEVEILEQYKALFGRLIISYHKGQTYSRYVFYFEKQIDDCEVVEILPTLYDNEKFQGYDQVNLSYKTLQKILSGERLLDYRTALEKITGIYCLTDTNTGKLYIGSASGEGGLAQRWGDYLCSKNGGNKKLVELHKKEGDEYFERYFRFTLIEFFGLNYDTEKILKREQYWKKCFSTIEHGYNAN